MLKMMLHIPTPRYTPERKCGSMDVSIAVVAEGEVGEAEEAEEGGEEAAARES